LRWKPWPPVPSRPSHWSGLSTTATSERRWRSWPCGTSLAAGRAPGTDLSRRPARSCHRPETRGRPENRNC